jgi:hypothetical protein
LNYQYILKFMPCGFGTDEETLQYIAIYSEKGYKVS